MADILLSLLFLALVSYPAISALLPVNESDAADGAPQSLAPALSPAAEAFGPEKAASAAPGR